VLTALVGMRVYRKNGQRQDDRGSYDGWSDRFDERIPVYSPRICKLLSQSTKSSAEEDELDETLDEVLKPADGHTRVWAVPRYRKCASSEYMRHIGRFCHQGGLDLILSIIANTETTDKPDGYNLCVMAILISLISLPSLIYHRTVIGEYGPKLIEAAKKGLLSAPDKALRDVRREHIEAIVKAVELLSRRIVETPEREKDIEVLKLEVARLCLNSSFMERRIQGIRDLNLIIRHNRIYAGRFPGKFLAEWMQSHGIFDILFDHKKTHLQLIQRSDEILKLLLSEDMLGEDLLKQFWSLTKTDLRLEVYKIISDCSMSFRQQHLDFVFD
jgi:ubiquitin carboxyl-terminal hydrolase 34